MFKIRLGTVSNCSKISSHFVETMIRPISPQSQAVPPWRFCSGSKNVVRKLQSYLEALDSPGAGCGWLIWGRKGDEPTWMKNKITTPSTESTFCLVPPWCPISLLIHRVATWGTFWTSWTIIMACPPSKICRDGNGKRFPYTPFQFHFFNLVTVDKWRHHSGISPYF